MIGYPIPRHGLFKQRGNGACAPITGIATARVDSSLCDAFKRYEPYIATP